MEADQWVDKYRPQTWDEVVGQDIVVKVLSKFCKNPNALPHMLFYGPAGTGKTTVAYIIVREVLGENWRRNFKEMNASVAPETPCLIRKEGHVERTTFGRLAEDVFVGEKSGRQTVDDIEILSLDSDYRICYLPVSWMSRHRVDDLVSIRYEGGFIRTSPDHSVMVMDENGFLISKEASKLCVGDHLVSFVDTMGPETNATLDFDSFSPNPKLTHVYENRQLNEDMAWLFGLYLAEGASSLNKNDSSGQLVWTVGYPHEEHVAKRANLILENELELKARMNLVGSGFDRSRKSGLQVRICNTQLTKFTRYHFYDDGHPKRAPFKRCPVFIFESSPETRRSFLKGYMGDASGEWKNYVRYASSSFENLVDIAWLGRTTGIDSSVYARETRLLWSENPGFSYVKSDLFPANLIQTLLRRLGIHYTYFLRHSLYGKKSGRISKSLVQKHLTDSMPESVDNDVAKRIMALLNSPLFVVRITDIQREPYSKYVYDVAVPGSEMFWGGTTPVLLHNSDERGIDTVRGPIKTYAKAAPVPPAPYKILFLDECDALTPDAQAALRRIMERYSAVTRFILSCNHKNRLIEPIRSRTDEFPFKPIFDDSAVALLRKIASNEWESTLTSDAGSALLRFKRGDMRSAINTLRSLVELSDGGEITTAAVEQLAGKGSDLSIIESIIIGDSGSTKDTLDEKMRHIDNFIVLLMTEGIDIEGILEDTADEIMRLDIAPSIKAKAIADLGAVHYRVVIGANPWLQLRSYLYRLACIGVS